MLEKENRNIRNRMKTALGLALVVIPVLGLICLVCEYGEVLKADMRLILS